MLSPHRLVGSDQTTVLVTHDGNACLYDDTLPDHLRRLAEMEADDRERGKADREGRGLADLRSPRVHEKLDTLNDKQSPGEDKSHHQPCSGACNGPSFDHPSGNLSDHLTKSILAPSLPNRKEKRDVAVTVNPPGCRITYCICLFNSRADAPPGWARTNLLFSLGPSVHAKAGLELHSSFVNDPAPKRRKRTTGAAFPSAAAHWSRLAGYDG